MFLVFAAQVDDGFSFRLNPLLRRHFPGGKPFRLLLDPTLIIRLKKGLHGRFLEIILPAFEIESWDLKYEDIIYKEDILKLFHMKGETDAEET